MDSLLKHSDTARRKGRQWRRIRNVIFFVILLGLIVWAGIRFYYPYGEGVKSGTLDFLVYEGFVFKTYEGKLIRSEIQMPASDKDSSNEFAFSISNKKVAEELMRAGNKTVELHYTEYLGAIPWRGCSRYVVGRIESISDEHEEN